VRLTAFLIGGAGTVLAIYGAFQLHPGAGMIAGGLFLTMLSSEILKNATED
jgi:hypothetical protein